MYYAYFDNFQIIFQYISLSSYTDYNYVYYSIILGIFLQKGLQNMVTLCPTVGWHYVQVTFCPGDILSADILSGWHFVRLPSTVKWQQHSLSHRSPSSDYSLYHYALWLQTFLLTFLWLTLFGEQYCHNVVYNNENREILACFYMKIARFLVRFSSAFQRFLSDAPRL